MSNRRNVRRKRALSEDEEEDEDPEEMSIRERLEATRELQKGRNRAQGILTDNLAGAQIEDKESVRNEEAVLGGYVKEQKKTPDAQIDAEKEQYIREQLDKRLGRSKAETEQKDAKKDYKDTLYAIPKALQAQKVEQEDVSAWMTGIVEVPLSLDQQLKNIEATELAKKQLLNSRDSLDVNPSSDAALKQDLRRITYPLRFGKQTNKEEAWRQEVLQREHQPKDWKRNKRV